MAQLTERDILHIGQKFLDNFARAGCKKNYPLFLKGNCFLGAVNVSHLDETNMTYWQHWRFAAGHAARCLIAAIQFIVHACLPEVFVSTGRRLLCRMKRDFACDEE